MPDEEFRLPGTSYDLLAQIIMAYGEIGRSASTSEVADIIDTHRTQVSRNNRFLVSVGIIKGGKTKEPSEKGIQLAQALQYEREGDIQQLWRELLKGNEFIEKILSAVKIRKGMERSDLESHIAYTSGSKKTGKVMTGAGTVADILLIAGFLEEKDGQLVVAGQLPSDEDGVGELPGRVRRQQLKHDEDEQQRILETEGPAISIQLQIQCSPEDLEDLGPRLKSLLEDLSQTEAEKAE